jgi:hypothetical protein
MLLRNELRAVTSSDLGVAPEASKKTQSPF